jgi:asparagine synthase (glutamine-hydrolysing)
MCGIAGFLPQKPGPADAVAARLRALVPALVHRGPDEEGSFVRPEIGLGVRRLSIIDRARGHQPMHSRDGRLTLVFNGEIYNYRTLRRELEVRGSRFDTHSDTEVLLRLLEVEGTDGIRRLEGMFAFAVWDAHESSLTLVRDWLGQKSLFWVRTAAGFAFASEIKALLALDDVPRKPDVAALSHYMSLRYLPGESTFFDGIRKLPPAQLLRVRDGRIECERLWTPRYEPKHRFRADEVVDRL